MICTLSRMLNPGERDATAAVIAAAPVTTGALETLVNLHDGMADGGNGITNADWANARAALAKARGEE